MLLGTILYKIRPIIFPQMLDACSHVKNVKHNQCFHTTPCLLPISAGAGLWCAIWPQSWKMCLPNIPIVCFLLRDNFSISLVTVQTVTWQVKNFGAQTTTALSRQKSRWNWERKFGKIKIVKRLTIFHLPFNIDHIVWKWEDLCI